MSTVEERTSMATDAGAEGAGRWSLLLLNVALMIVGGLGGPLLTRIYFMHGGGRLWLSSLLQVCGFPILSVPLSISYVRRRRRVGWRAAEIFQVTTPVAAAAAALGVLTGLDAYMYAQGSIYLPLSTSSLLISSQLAFTALFAFLVVRQRFTAYSINAVVLLVLAAVVLGVQAAGDRPAGESDAKYYLGFFMMLGAAALLGLLLPLIELTYVKVVRRKVTYSLVMEIQAVMSVCGSALCVVGMLVNKDFQAIPREAREYGLGEVKYYLLLVFCAVGWQLLNLGMVGIVSCSTSLLAGIVASGLVPVGSILPVFILHEKFHSVKGVALALSLWGFTSYFYGEHEQQEKTKRTHATEVELPAPSWKINVPLASSSSTPPLSSASPSP